MRIEESNIMKISASSHQRIQRLITSCETLSVMVNNEVPFTVTSRTTVRRAHTLGRVLIRIKKQVGHGRWLPWLKANTTIGGRQILSDRVASKYMRVAKIDRAQIESFPTLNDALGEWKPNPVHVTRKEAEEMRNRLCKSLAEKTARGSTETGLLTQELANNNRFSWERQRKHK